MDVLTDFTRRVRDASRMIAAADGGFDDAVLERVMAEPPRDPSHGDIATNAALVLAKPLAMKPRDFATRLAMELERDEDVEAVEVAGPGFVNLRLRDVYWSAKLIEILDRGEAYGHGDQGRGRRVNVEYVSTNPTGPMHVGHGRGAVVGDAIASLLVATGHEVTREYYINDAGGQIDILARSVLLRAREAMGEEIGEIPAGLYPGDYLVPLGRDLARAHGEALLSMSEDEAIALVGRAAIDAMMALIREDLAALGVTHDVFFSEASLQGGTIADTIETMRARDLVYEGRLPPPKGQPSDDWEDREQTLFRSTEYGDDVDRPLVKSDGSYTYFASDIAYHYDKLKRGFEHLIDVLGADHGGYVKRMKAAVAALSGGDVSLEVKLCQLVKLYRRGEPVRMSKRSGDIVTLRDVIDEVGRDAVRFMMLFRKSDAPLDFDLAVVTEQSKDNPVFYVQYAHARTCSVLRQAREDAPDVDQSPDRLAKADLSLLVDEGERALIRLLADFPRVVSGSATSREPHRLAFYLHDLASAYHAHWNKGKDSPQLRFIVEGHSDMTRARLAFVSAIGLVLRSGLAILGVDAPREMR